MPKKASESPSLGERLTIALLGDSGAGKTTSAATAPGPKYVFGFDPDWMEPLKRRPELIADMEYDDYPLQPMRPIAHNASDKSRLMESGYAGQSWERAIAQLQALMTLKPYPYKTTIIDSVTNMSEACFEKIRADADCLDKNPKSLDVYMLLGTQCWIFLRSFMSLLPGLKILICHDEVDRDELKGTLIHRIAGEGSMLARKLQSGKDIKEIWRCTRKTDQGKFIYRIETNNSEKFPCKSGALGLVGTYEPNITRMLELARVSVPKIAKV